MSKKLKFYSIKNILTKLAHYNVIFGERSNGKTYSVLEYGLQKYFDTGEQMVIVRRWEEDFVGANSARTCFDSLTKNANGENVIHKMSGGKYTGVTYYTLLPHYSKRRGERRTYRRVRSGSLCYICVGALQVGQFPSHYDDTL